MLRADLLRKIQLLPRVVNVLADSSAQGCSTSPYSEYTYAWVLHRQSLLVWRAEDGLSAAVRRLELPEAPIGRTFVEVVPQRQSTALTVIACTGAGQLHVWLDATFLGKPFTQQLATSSTDSNSDSVICALAASPADAGAGPGFLAVVATSDAALHLYHGSQSGIFPRQFHQPSSTHSSRGVIDLLGTAVKAVYDGQMFAGSSFLRAAASAAPALQLQLLQLDSSRWKLLVLTADALDCWLLGTLSGKQSSEQLLWSYSIYQAVLGRQRVVESKVLAFKASSAAGQQQQAPVQDPDSSSSASQEIVYVWSAYMAESTVRYQQTCSAFAVDGGLGRGPRLIVSQPIDTAAAALPRPRSDLRGWQLVANTQQPSCLMKSPDGVLLEWRRASGAPAVLSSSSDNLAITSCSYSSSWKVLNASYGVLEFSTDGVGPAAQHQPIDAARALLDRVVNMMHEEYLAGYSCRGLATGLDECLSELGLLQSREGAALLLATSSSLVDKLPKAGTLSSEDLRRMMSHKQVRHSLLLLALQVGGVLRRLPVDVLAALFEHAQMLAAAAEVLKWQRRCEAAAQGGENLNPVDKRQAEASGRAIAAAGRRATAGEGGPGGAAHQQVEVFFGQPTVSLPALFQAVADAAADIRQSAAGAPAHSGSVSDLLQQLLGLCGLLVAAAGAADAVRQQYKQETYNEVTRADTAGPGWLAAAGPCAACGQLAEASLAVLPLLSGLSQQQQLSHEAHLPALSRLLTAMRATLDTRVDDAAEQLQAYHELPWRHGEQLLHVAQQELPQLKARGVLVLSEELQDTDDVLTAMPGLQETIVWHLQTLAQEHRCWQLLYATCEVISSISPGLEGQLQQHMKLECAASNGALARDGFTYYVMHRWHRQHLVVDLLQLGGQQGFMPQLQQYLADCPELLWMSQVQAQQYQPAAHTLSTAASSAPAGDARRMWCLAKLSAKAAGAQGGSSRRVMGTATARLRQLQLQAQLVPGDSETVWQSEALAATALQAAAEPAAAAPGGYESAAGGVLLKGADAAVAAVEVLALDVSDHQADSFRHLWESGWQAVLRSTPLQELAAERASVAQGGWQSDDYQAAVQGCALFRALVAGAAALQEVAQVVPTVNPREELQVVGAGLMPHVQQPAAQEVFADVLSAASATAAAAGMGT